jgi:capsular polysaccharide biosynthesis protein
MLRAHEPALLMDLRTYLRVAWKPLLLIAFLAAATAALAFVTTSAAEKLYTADARIVVASALGTDGGGADDGVVAPLMGQTYAVLAMTRPALVEVIERADLPYDATELKLRLQVTSAPESPFLDVSVTDQDPTRAAATANAVADHLVEMASQASTDVTPARTLLVVVERAAVPIDPSSPRVLVLTIIAAGAAFVLGLAVLSLAIYLAGDRSVRGTVTG